MGLVIVNSVPILCFCSEANNNKNFQGEQLLKFIMIFFDYIFYRVYKFYFEFNESSPCVFGIAALSFSMYFNLYSFATLLKPTLENLFGFNILDGHWLAGGILCFNITRYTWIKPYVKLEKDLENKKNKLTESIKGWLVLIYLFCSLILALYLTGFFKR